MMLILLQIYIYRMQEIFEIYHFEVVSNICKLHEVCSLSAKESKIKSITIVQSLLLLAGGQLHVESIYRRKCLVYSCVNHC